MRKLATSPTPISPSDSFDAWRAMGRQDHLVMNQIGDEVLVYDETTHAIHHLNSTSHLVWTLCDGTRTLPVIGQAAGAALGAEVSDTVVRLALSQLAEAQLLVDVLPSEVQEPRQSRRVLLRRMAIAGGVALPTLASISAPTAAVASSHCGGVGQPCCPSSTGGLIGTCKTFGLSCQQGTCKPFT